MTTPNALHALHLDYLHREGLLIRQALERHGGAIRATAAELGCSESALRKAASRHPGLRTIMRSRERYYAEVRTSLRTSDDTEHAAKRESW